ncbi:MAG: phosphatidate cytidylyltransferase [Burkholderiales bacterium]|nr:phosphatidate cytidylyltransferase [Opitutaceae bacterium]
MNWLIPEDAELRWLLGGLLGLLLVASGVGAALARRARGEKARAVVENLNARIRAWWVMVGFFSVAVLAGRGGAVVLFAGMSFMALREFITLTPTHRADHRALFWVFFVITPAHYWLVWREWYGLFSIFIPVYACLWLPMRNALAGETKDFLARTAKAQWALMVCVYFLSHAPALLTLPLPGGPREGAKLLFFLVVVVQMSDVLQYCWGKTLGRRPIVPKLSPSKTLEGFVGGVASASALGAGLWWLTPFTPGVAALMALAICVMGFFGGLVMSAIKRDRGVKDFGAMIEGHGGMLDRIDSLCFAAPLFFHLTRYWYT